MNLCKILRLVGVLALAFAVLLPERVSAWEVTSMFSNKRTVLIENRLPRKEYGGCSLTIRLTVWVEGRIRYSHIHGERGPDKQLRMVVIPPGAGYPLTLDNNMAAPSSATVEIEVEASRQEIVGQPPISCGKERTTRTLCPSCGGYGVDRWEVTNLRRPY